MADRVETIRGDWDEDGYHLHVSTDDDDHEFRVTSIEAARELLRAADDVRAWVGEHDREFALYSSASQEERAQVLGLTRLDRPIYPDAISAGERLREQADDRRKADRENR